MSSHSLEERPQSQPASVCMAVRNPQWTDQSRNSSEDGVHFTTRRAAPELWEPLLVSQQGSAAPVQERSATVSRGSLHRGKVQAPEGLGLSSFFRRRLPLGGDPPPPEGHVLSVDILTTSPPASEPLCLKSDPISSGEHVDFVKFKSLKALCFHILCYGGHLALTLPALEASALTCPLPSFA